MFTFKQYLQLHESTLTESKNLHLEHIEDEVLNHGLRGATKAVNMIQNIADTLRGHTKSKVNITTKWDGSPAIVVGIDPETGKFFVGTKSVFNKRTPKQMFSKADIKKHYSEQPELASKLEAAFTHLSKLGIKGVMQGDLMFTDDDVKEETIDGEDFITFKPNTIVYAVPAKSDLAKQIKKAKIGVVFHTSYSGDSISNMKASYDVNVKNLRSPSVWLDDASYKDLSGTVTMTEKETRELYNHIDEAKRLLNQIPQRGIDSLLSNKHFVQILKMHTNNEIRSGSQYKNFMQNLEKFIDTRIDKDRGSDATKERKRAEYREILKKNKKTLQQVVQLQKHINTAKLILIDKLQSIQSIGTFLQDDKGFTVTSPEGFVAVDHLSKKAVKLVKRLEFSKANFAKNS